MYIEREITKTLKRVATKFPVVMLTGPRQSGKSTLLKHVFPKKEYVSLEDPDIRRNAQKDPRGFLNGFPKGAILDEVQRVPEMFSYIQTNVDEDKRSGKFILSGSQNFLLMKSVTQSLAGRVSILRLLPLSMKELSSSGVNLKNMNKTMHSGFFPRLFNKKINVMDFYPAYVESYLQRDVRELERVGDLGKFNTFLHLCAGRVGQILNMSSLANDCGISVPTATSWISVLEASYAVFLLQPHSENFNKRLVKTPKLYFSDTGLACSLLGIKNEQDLRNHYYRGPLLENLVLMELLKTYYNKGDIRPQIYFWRDKLGNEVDFLVQDGKTRKLIEVKASETQSGEHFSGIRYYGKISNITSKNQFVVYGGNKRIERQEGTYIPWNECFELA